ncbi:hypothetical protein MHB71_05025 [Paenibacillus sp. FSL H7-0940]|uniref:hypothetical protein n=1 Tax=Paenibacillus sp. FSL H7-0940 TaxID=2921443 RepID=UPI0030EC3C1E
MKLIDVNKLFEADVCLGWLVKEVRKATCCYEKSGLQILFLLHNLYELPHTAYLDSKERSMWAAKLTEEHFEQFGKMPDSTQLERLATWILAPEMPADVFSDRQMRRRVNDKEVLFYAPQRNNYDMEIEGNRYVKPKPGMDSEESHKDYVRLPSDRADKRQFNGPLEKYLLEGGSEDDVNGTEMPTAA